MTDSKNFLQPSNQTPNLTPSLTTLTKSQTIIIGGGIVGASLALKLAQAQRSVVLIDAKSALSEEQWQTKLSKRDARVYALSLASIELLKDIGVWQRIEQSQRKADYTQMHVWQTNGVGELKFADEYDRADQGGNKDVDTDCECGIETDGHGRKLLGSMVEPVVIEHAIFQQIQQVLADEETKKYLTVISGHQLASIDWLGDELGYQVLTSHVSADEQYTMQAKLLIGADGRGSAVRKLAGIDLDTLDYEQTAVCCAIKTEKPHLATARQAMLPTGTLALLPMADISEQDKQYPHHWQSVVWTLPTIQAIDLLTNDDGTIAKELAFASGYELGNIEQIESIASFPLNAQQAQSYIKPNLALVGDAAHGVHPLAGQGLNLGMLDVTELAHLLLNDAKRSRDKYWGEWQTLQRYERHRLANNSGMMHSFSLINWLFAGEFAQVAPFQHLRSEGMALVGRTTPLMRWFSRQASGL